MLFIRNVHFRISLREMLKAYCDAVYTARKKCQSQRSLNLRLAVEGRRIFNGYVPFPAQIGQETQRNKNFGG